MDFIIFFGPFWFTKKKSLKFLLLTANNKSWLLIGNFLVNWLDFTHVAEKTGHCLKMHGLWVIFFSSSFKLVPIYGVAGMELKLFSLSLFPVKWKQHLPKHMEHSVFWNTLIHRNYFVEKLFLNHILLSAVDSRVVNKTI